MNRRHGRVLLALAAGMVGCGDSSAQTFPESDFFESRGAYLSYEIDLPAGAGPFSGVVLGHGSGRQTKENVRSLARQFVALGFAVLRFDKRGVGGSTGQYSGVGPANSDFMFDLLADDMVAGAAVLRDHPDVDPTSVGFSGVSQAGWIIPLAAFRDAATAFAAIVVGPTVTVGLEIFYSDLVEKSTLPIADALQRLPEFDGPRGYDPVPIIEQLQLPMLWLYGEADRSIPTKESVEILENIIRRGNKPFAHIVYPNAGHSLRDVDTGAAVDIWPDIEDWLTAAGFMARP
jgi:pimeloyl-ACP methyl ester carboxylesterase